MAGDARRRTATRSDEEIMANPYASSGDTDTLCVVDPLAYNLGLANNTLRFTAQMINHGAGDKAKDDLEHLGWPLVATGLNQGERIVRRAFKSMNSVREAEFAARRATTYGAGNCGEQAAVAFIYLRDQGAKPIALMSIANGDHAFVLIGFGPLSQEWEPYTWGPNAVICDPWLNQAYPAVQFYSHMNWKPGLRPEVEIQVPASPSMPSWAD